MSLLRYLRFTLIADMSASRDIHAIHAAPRDTLYYATRRVDEFRLSSLPPPPRQRASLFR